MQKVKDWLKPISDYFLSGFSDTFQLLLDNFLGDYLEDPKQLNMSTLLKGIEMLQLNKAFINQLLGQCPFRLEEAYIESIKVANLKFEARGLKLVFAFTDKINVEELKAYLSKTQELKLREIQKLEQLNKLRDEVYKECSFEQSQDLTRSMGPQTGLIQFLSLVDTLLSNSSVTFKNIEICFKADGGKQYQFRIESTNIDFQKPDFNNLLFISFSIDKIELMMNKEKLALIENAVKFEMIVETKNNRVNTKIDGKISILDIVLNQKQTISLLETIQYYLKLTDDLDKIVQEFFGAADEKTNEPDLFHSVKHQPTEQSIIGSQSTIRKFQKEQVIIHSYMDTLNNNLQHSLAQHPIQLQQEKQFIEFSQSIFASCDHSFGRKSLRNQAEAFKCQFEGIRFAVCEKSSTFPSLKGRFFQDLESHFFVEITNISAKYHKDQLSFSIKSIGAHRIKSDQNVVNTMMQSQEFFKSCLENPKISYQVTPVIMMGLAEVGKIEQEYATYNFDKLQEQCKLGMALEVTVQILHGKKREKFYSAQIKLSDFIASINHELLLKLLTYLPQKQVQLVQTEEKEKLPCLFGFDIACPYINVNYCFLNKPIQMRIKDIKVKQSPVQKFPHKLGILEPLDCVPIDQKPYQFIVVSFFNIWIEFQGQNILTIGQNVVTDLQIFPLFYISFHQKIKNQLIEIEEKKQDNQFLSASVNNYCFSSELVIKGSLPLIELKLTQDLLFWAISIQSQLENTKPKKQMSHIKKNQEENSQQYFQLTVDSLTVYLLDYQNKDLFSLMLSKLSVIQTNKLVVLFQDLTLVDCQAADVLYNQQKIQQQYQKHPAHQIMIYRTSLGKKAAQQIIINKQKKRFYSQPLEVDFQNYIFKLILQGNFASVSAQNICVRIPDFSFKSFKKLNPLMQQFQNQKQKVDNLKMSQPQMLDQQENEFQFKIKLKNNIYLDIFPINEIEELTYDGLKCSQQVTNGRVLIHIQNVKATNKQVNLQKADIFVCRQNGFEFQCPLILDNTFNKLNVFQFYDCIKIERLSFKDKELKLEILTANFTFDVIETLLEVFEDVSPFLPQTVAKPATKVNYVINPNLETKLIENSDPDTEIQIIIPNFNINLFEGHTYFQQPIYIDEITTTFEEELANFILMFDQLHIHQQDAISIKLTNTLLNVELYNEGQTGIRLKTFIEVYDRIKSSQFELIMSPDFEMLDQLYSQFDYSQSNLDLGLVLEDRAYTALIKLLPLRICISGAFLQFLFKFFNSKSYIKRNVFEDEIQICSKLQEKQIINLKQLQIMETNLNFSYDSQGLKMDAFLKGILKISSFYDLQIPLKHLSVSVQGTPEDVVQTIINQFQQSLGSKIKITGKALSSLEAFSVITNLLSGTLSLILSPFEEGLVAGTKKGLSDFSSSFARALLKAIEIPTSAIVAGGEQFGLSKVAMPFRYVNERSSEFLEKISPSSIPKRFYKHY